MMEESKTPKELGMDENKLLKMDRELEINDRNINGIVVVKNGNIAFEKYYNGHDRDDNISVASVTKSVISALVGIAIDKGYIKDVDEKVLSFFPKYNASPRQVLKKSITIENLLTMTAGLPSGKNEAWDRFIRQPNWIDYALDAMGERGKVGKFGYSTLGTHILSGILTRSTGMSAREFANKNLFKPIGMREIEHFKMKAFDIENVFGKGVQGWVEDPQGNSAGGWGITLNTRDMAKFGLLHMNGGMHKKVQVISKDWIEKSTSVKIDDYGYLWWVFKEDNVDLYAALGQGGNAIFCIPKENLVVAMSSKIIMKTIYRWPLIKDYIL